MTKGRLEAFSDGVIAIMVLELKVPHGGEGVLARALGRDFKGHVSLLLYLLAIGLAFAAPWMAWLLYAAVALLWLIPDRRIVQALEKERRV